MSPFVNKISITGWVWVGISSFSLITNTIYTANGFLSIFWSINVEKFISGTNCGFVENSNLSQANRLVFISLASFMVILYPSYAEMPSASHNSYVTHARIPLRLFSFLSFKANQKIFYFSSVWTKNTCCTVGVSSVWHGGSRALSSSQGCWALPMSVARAPSSLPSCRGCLPFPWAVSYCGLLNFSLLTKPGGFCLVGFFSFLQSDCFLRLRLVSWNLIGQRHQYPEARDTCVRTK